MIDFISGLFIDLSLFGGIILLALSFAKRFKKHQPKMIVTSVILLVIWFVFIDMGAVYEAFQQGVEAGRGN